MESFPQYMIQKLCNRTAVFAQLSAKRDTCTDCSYSVTHFESIFQIRKLADLAFSAIVMLLLASSNQFILLLSVTSRDRPKILMIWKYHNLRRLCPINVF